MSAADVARRFSGLERLYGVGGAAAIGQAHVAVVGIGGVGSWAVEALARSGVGRISLVDFDQVAESNINRQIQAETATVGMAKVDAMAERIARVNPSCTVQRIEEFATPENWASMVDGLERQGLSAVIDACDQVKTKTALAAWARSRKALFISVGAAGGKRRADKVEIADLSEATHDPLLAQLRYRLRREHAAPRDKRIGVNVVFSRESVAAPDASCAMEDTDGTLNCHGYGSVVSVTASFGMCAAGWVLDKLSTSTKPQ